VVCECFLNQRSDVKTARWKIGNWSGGDLQAAGVPSHGTTGTMVNPALGFTATASSRNNTSGVLKDPRRPLPIILPFQYTHYYAALVHKLSTPWKSQEHTAWLILCFSKFLNLLMCLSSSMHPVPLPKPQTGSESMTTSLDGMWNPASPADLQSFRGLCETAKGTRCSAIAERERCRMRYSFCQK